MPNQLERDDRIPLPQATSLDRLSRPCPCAKSRHRWRRPTSQTTIAPKGRTPQAPRQHLPQRRRAGDRAGGHYFDGAPTIAPSIHRRRKPNLGTTPRTYIHAAPKSKVPLTSSRPGAAGSEGNAQEGRRKNEHAGVAADSAPLYCRHEKGREVGLPSNIFGPEPLRRPQASCSVANCLSENSSIMVNKCQKNEMSLCVQCILNVE